MIIFFEKIGQIFIGAANTLSATILFSINVVLKMFIPKSYNSAMRMVLVNQIYYTSVQILPLFIIFSIILGSSFIGILVKVIKDLNLSEYLGKLLMGFVVTEFSPFITVILIALRSCSAINTEIAVMKVNNELNSLEVFNIDPVDYLFLPRIINGIISVVLLSSLFSIVVLASGSLFCKFFFGMSIIEYSNILLVSAIFSDIVILILKCTAFGFFSTLVSVYSGMNATHELTSIPVAVLKGMVRVFISILTIEVLSLIIRFI